MTDLVKPTGYPASIFGVIQILRSCPRKKKLFKLKKSKTPTFDVPFTSRTVPVLNLSALNLNLKGWKYDLHHCFIDKENVHAYLRKMTNKFTQNNHHTKDNTYNDLHHLRNNKNIVLVSGDKESSIVVMNKVDYGKKVNGMIKEGIKEGKYEMTRDTTRKDLEKLPLS